MSLAAILIVAALGIVSTLVAVCFMRDNGWDMVFPLVADGILAVVYAFHGLVLLPNEDIANGLALFLGIMTTLVYWTVLAAAVVATHWLARTYWRSGATSD